MSDDIHNYISRIDNILKEYDANVSIPTNAPKKTKANNKNDKENNGLVRLANTRYNTFEKLESLVKRMFILHYTDVYVPPPESHTCNNNNKKKRKRPTKKIEKLCEEKVKKTFGSGRIGVSSDKYKPRSCICCEPQLDEDLLFADILKAPPHSTKINNERPVFIDLTNATSSTSGFASSSRKWDNSVICIPDSSPDNSSDENSVIDLDSTSNINIKKEDSIIVIDNLDLETGTNSETRNFANVENITGYLDLVITDYDEDEMRRHEEELLNTINQDNEIKTETPDNVPNVKNEEVAVRIDQDIEMETEPPDNVPNFANIENITDYIDLVTTDYDEDEMRRHEEELIKMINQDIEIKTEAPDNIPNVENEEVAVRVDQDIEMETVPPDNVPNFANVENITDYLDLVTTDYDEDEMRKYEEELAEMILKTELEPLSAANKNREENSVNEINASKSASSFRSNLSCPICFEDLDGKEIMSTICGHLFCAECIKEVIKKTKSCPNCRKKLTLKSIHPIYLASVL